MTTDDLRTYVSGDWEIEDGDETMTYSHVYEVVDLGQPWNGFDVPIFDRSVLAYLCERQPVVMAENGVHEYEELEILEDGRLRISYARCAPEQPDHFIEPDEDGFYTLDLGWTWSKVDSDEDRIGIRVQRSEDASNPYRAQVVHP